MAGVHSEWRRGGLLGYDGWRRSGFSDAPFARYVNSAFEHYTPSRLTSTTTYPGFDVTVLTAGTLVMSDRAGGWLGLVGGADGQGIQMQSDGLVWAPTANRNIWFECSILAEDADDIDWRVGLADTDADVLTGDPTEAIWFTGADGSANINFQVRNGGAGAAADTGSDLADNTAVRLGFEVIGITSVVPYINGTALTAVTANIPAGDLMSITFGMFNGGTTANQALEIDWYSCCQLIQ